MSDIELPEAREDGQCCKCEKHPAVTTDNRFCRQCLWNMICRLNPDIKTCRDQKWAVTSKSEKNTDGDIAWTRSER